MQKKKVDEHGNVPKDCIRAIIIHLQGKGGRILCENYRSTSIVGKVYG